MRKTKLHNVIFVVLKCPSKQLQIVNNTCKKHNIDISIEQVPAAPTKPTSSATNDLECVTLSSQETPTSGVKVVRSKQKQASIITFTPRKVNINEKKNWIVYC